MRRLRRLWTLLTVLAVLGAGNASAADFYQGKTITVISGGAPGGGHDTHTRLVASHIGKHILGKPNVIVQNMPEATGITAVNYVFNVAPKDGTYLGQFLRDSLFTPMLGQEQAKFKPEELNWIGTPASYSDDAFLIIVRTALGYRTMEDVRNAKTPLNIGNHGTVLIPLVKEGLAANAKILTGYKSGENILALERGELDGIGASYINLSRRNPDWIAKNFIQIIVQYGHSKRLPELPNVPTARELALTPGDLDLIKFCELPLVLGFPLGAPPGVPPDRVALLRKAFMETMVDPDYRAAVDKAKLEFSPKSGESLAADLVEAAKVPAEAIARYKLLVGGSQ